MKKILFILFIVIFYNAQAQHTPIHINNNAPHTYRGRDTSGISLEDFDQGAAVSVSADYDVPIARFAYVFKPAIAYTLHLKTFHDNFIYNYSIGYEVFKPKVDTFYYRVNDTGFGTQTFQNFTSVSAYIGVAYNIRATKRFWIYGGLNMGAYFTHYVDHSVDQFVDSSEDFHEEDLYIAPKIGITYVLSTNVLLSYESKYNLFAPLGQTSDNGRVGTLYNTIGNGISITFKF